MKLKRGQVSKYQKLLFRQAKSMGITFEDKEEWAALKRKCRKQVETGSYDPNILRPTREIWIREHKAILKDRATESELIMRKYLLAHKIKFRFQQQVTAVKKIYFMDFYLPDFNVALEVDGGSHNDPKQKGLDNIRDYHLAWIGIKTVRITNDEVKSPATLDAFMRQHEFCK